MAHLVEKMVRASGTKASWHRLEDVMPEGATLQEWQQGSGLAHTVEKTPVIYASQSEAHISEDKFVLYRSDTKKLLSVVGPDYNVVQPIVLFEFFADLIKHYGFTMDTAGCLAGGRRIWVLARTGREFLVGNSRDLVKEYVLFATSYDGTLATTAKHTSVRVVCNNTLNLSTQDGTGVRVVHSKTFDPVAVKLELGLMHDDWTRFKVQANLMHDIGLTDELANRWYVELLAEEADMSDEDVAAFQTSRVLKDLMTVYRQGAGAEATLWGAVQGVTGLCDNWRGRTPDTRLNSAWFGAGAAMKKAAWDKAVALI